MHLAFLLFSVALGSNFTELCEKNAAYFPSVESWLKSLHSQHLYDAVTLTSPDKSSWAQRGRNKNNEDCYLLSQTLELKYHYLETSFQERVTLIDDWKMERTMNYVFSCFLFKGDAHFFMKGTNNSKFIVPQDFILLPTDERFSTYITIVDALNLALDKKWVFVDITISDFVNIKGRTDDLLLPRLDALYRLDKYATIPMGSSRYKKLRQSCEKLSRDIFRSPTCLFKVKSYINTYTLAEIVLEMEGLYFRLEKEKQADRAGEDEDYNSLMQYLSLQLDKSPKKVDTIDNIRDYISKTKENLTNKLKKTITARI